LCIGFVACDCFFCFRIYYFCAVHAC
jgi:hypothetical protein